MFPSHSHLKGKNVHIYSKSRGLRKWRRQSSSSLKRLTDFSRRVWFWCKVLPPNHCGQFRQGHQDGYYWDGQGAARSNWKPPWKNDEEENYCSLFFIQNGLHKIPQTLIETRIWHARWARAGGLCPYTKSQNFKLSTFSKNWNFWNSWSFWNVWIKIYVSVFQTFACLRTFWK